MLFVISSVLPPVKWTRLFFLQLWESWGSQKRIYLSSHNGSLEIAPTSRAVGEPTFTSHESSIYMKWSPSLQHLDCNPNQAKNKNALKTQPPRFAIFYSLALRSWASYLISEPQLLHLQNDFLEYRWLRKCMWLFPGPSLVQGKCMGHVIFFS